MPTLLVRVFGSTLTVWAGCRPQQDSSLQPPNVPQSASAHLTNPLCAVSAAEDPEKILDQAVEDMQTDLIRLRQAAAEVTASQKRLGNKYDLAQKTAVRFMHILLDFSLLF
jgi:hypothetical protein